MPWSPILQIAERLQHDSSVSVQPRRSDWGLSGLRKKTHHLTSGFETVWRARTANTLVVCNAAIEMLVIATLRPILARHLNLVAVDFLLPAPTVAKRLLLRLLSRFERVFCIRSGDMAALHRWCGVPIERLAFIPFPANESLLDLDTTDDGYVYAAGSAHRDWSVLMEALEHLAPDTPQITISTSDHLTIPPAVAERVRLMGPLSPEDGREQVRRARCVVIPTEPTDLPHGPLVLLDAMAMGKPIVCSRTAGAIDYVIDGVNGIVVAPRDPAALANAIERVLADHALRKQLGENARRSCRENFTAEAFAETLLSEITKLPRRGSAPP